MSLSDAPASVCTALTAALIGVLAGALAAAPIDADESLQWLCRLVLPSIPGPAGQGGAC